jgi:hypothetical protein
MVDALSVVAYAPVKASVKMNRNSRRTYCDCRAMRDKRLPFTTATSFSLTVLTW